MSNLRSVSLPIIIFLSLSINIISFHQYKYTIAYGIGSLGCYILLIGFVSFEGLFSFEELVIDHLGFCIFLSEFLVDHDADRQALGVGVGLLDFQELFESLGIS